MVPDFWEMFLLAFAIIAVGYAFLASWTTIFYKRKSPGQLTRGELKVKQGTASFEVRTNLFVRALFSSLFTYQIYLLALLTGGAAYLLTKYLMR